MEVLGVYYQPDVIDCWTVVTNERDPVTGYATMLALGSDPTVFSQFTDGLWIPDGDNSHLGAEACLIGKQLVEHVMERLGEDGDAAY